MFPEAASSCSRVHSWVDGRGLCHAKERQAHGYGVTDPFRPYLSHCRKHVFSGRLVVPIKRERVGAVDTRDLRGHVHHRLERVSAESIQSVGIGFKLPFAAVILHHIEHKEAVRVKQMDQYACPPDT